MSQGKHAGSRSCESQEKDSPGEPPEGSSPITPQFLDLLKKFYYFLAVPCSMWDLSSVTRDQTHDIGGRKS